MKSNNSQDRLTNITIQIQDNNNSLHSEFNSIYSDICDKMVDVEKVKTDMIKLDGTIREQHTMINTLDDICTEIKNALSLLLLRQET